MVQEYVLIVHYTTLQKTSFETQSAFQAECLVAVVCNSHTSTLQEYLSFLLCIVPCLCHSGLAYDTHSVLSHVLCSHVVRALFAEAVLPFLAVETEGKALCFLW